MGWYWQRKDKGETVREFFARELSHLEILESATLARTEFYAAVRKPDTGEVRAFIALLGYKPDEQYNFGFKPMDESMGPYYYNCPARILDLLTPIDSETANDWRSKCREVLARKAEHRATRLKIRPGYRVRFAEGQFNLRDPEFIAELPPGTKTRTGMRYRHVATGQLYRIPTTAIVEKVTRPGGPGRPRLPRDADGNIIRESQRTQ